MPAALAAPHACHHTEGIKEYLKHRRGTQLSWFRSCLLDSSQDTSGGGTSPVHRCVCSLIHRQGQWGLSVVLRSQGTSGPSVLTPASVSRVTGAISTHAFWGCQVPGLLRLSAIYLSRELCVQRIMPAYLMTVIWKLIANGTGDAWPFWILCNHALHKREAHLFWI